MHMRILPTLETEAFINERGYLAILQHGERQEEALIVLSPAQARSLAKAMLLLCKRSIEWWPGDVVTIERSEG